MTDRIWFSPAAFALLWIALALIVSETTFHLAPAIVAAAPQLQHPHRQPQSLILGTVIAVVASLILSALGALSGPSLLPIGGALLESLSGAAGGGAIGYLAGRQLMRAQATTS